MRVVVTEYPFAIGLMQRQRVADAVRDPRRRVRLPMQLALARGHRWLVLLESGEVKSLRELAKTEGVDSSYVSRMVNLTTLAPDIVAAILDETLPEDLTLFDLAVDPPALWEGQQRRMGVPL
jgi:hypothetical protein